jgi:hypothetical protein
MRPRAFVCAVTITALATTPLAVAAQPVAPGSAVPSPAPTECHVGLKAARLAPERFAVVLDVPHQDDAVDVQIDDPTGHWTYVVKQPDALLTAPTTSSFVALGIVGEHRSDGTTISCPRESGVLYANLAYASDLVHAVGEAAPQAPDASFTDPPASCAVPFSNATVLHAQSHVDEPASGATGLVQVLVVLDEHSNIVSTSIYHSDDPSLDATSLAAARTSTYRTEQYRCTGLPSRYIFSVDFSRPR